ncbi:related to C6 zink-finger protein PRO1A [Cephalotrichum gorgonifer]|uniref:Related to C6 zink-finger protein PRO1A n=1 Tax=Cephalotrichum gorgonifer TaxID=2041049 RepID=A0AAE8N851_9PEZI|nr:related to C6 zink-finger protein PRO1A [Cephalotrichum gorgonifer]
MAPFQVSLSKTIPPTCFLHQKADGTWSTRSVIREIVIEQISTLFGTSIIRETRRLASTIMHRSLRSRQGCWTCRLRKKKCDEARPQCETCRTLCIACHGYGPKPDWMDGGDAERKVAGDIKQTVKHTSRQRKWPSNPVVPLPRLAAKLAPRDSDSSVESTVSRETPSSRAHQVSPPVDDGLLPREPSSQGAISDEPSPETTSGSVVAMSAEETSLLMHFIDNVFPLQYPMYKPDAMQGGRGWLLSLLLGTKPLYHAALAVGAYHRWLTIFANAGPQCLLVATLRKEQHVEACLKEVQDAVKTVNRFVEESRLDIGIGTVASVCQLVFLELFTGQDEGAWRMHLNGAIEMYRLACTDELLHLDLKERSRVILRDNLPITIDGAAVTSEVATMRFMTGSLLWLDILASITYGSTPRLQSLHSSLLAPDSMIKLEGITGCRNWALVQIGRIAALHSRNEEARRTGHIDDATLDRALDEIREEVDYELSREALEDYSVTVATGMLDLRGDGADPVALVTRMFAYTALVYAHIVKHGFQKLDLLETTISGALWLLRNRVTPRLIPVLVCPLYILGCTARQGPQRDLFCEVFSSKPFLDSLFKHRERILPIVEDIWSRTASSASGPGFPWSETLKLHRDILLI